MADNGGMANKQEQDDAQPEEFLNRAARRAQKKSTGRPEHTDRGAARPVRSGQSGPSVRQFTNRRTGG